MMGGRPSIDVDISGNVIRYFLDTRAKISVIEYDLLKGLGRFRVNETTLKLNALMNAY